MCGIIASITTDTYVTKLDSWYKDAFIASQVRGLHAAGIFQVNKMGAVLSAKRAGPAQQFIETADAKRLISDAPRMPLTVGHVRHATQGDQTKDFNAHPFIANRKDGSRVVGVHNGTLTGWRDKKDGTTHDVDSAWAFNIFAQEGPVDAFEYFNGAFAFIWHDTKYPDHVWMSRNKERPLHFFRSEDGKTTLFASELGMLGWLTDRHGMKGAKDGKFFYLRDDKIYKFSLKEPGAYEEMDRPEYDAKTSIRKPVVELRPNNGRYKQRYDRGFYDDDDGWYGGFGEGWYDSRTGRSGSYAQSSNHSSVRTGGWSEGPTIDAVKEALRKVRYTKLDEGSKKTEDVDGEVVDGDDADRRLQDGIQHAIGNFELNKAHREVDAWALVGERYDVKNFSVVRVTNDEIKLAKELGLFGKAVAFTGVIWDDQLAEVCGETYVMFDKTSAATKCDCLMRGQTGARAKATFIDVNTAVPVVVVGAIEGGLVKNEIAFIVEPMAKDALEDLKKKMQKAGTKAMAN